MNVFDRRILPLAVDNLPVITRFIQKNSGHTHRFPQIGAAFDFRLGQALAVTQANISVYLFAWRVASNFRDDLARFFMFFGANPVWLTVRAIVGKLHAIAKDDDVENAE